MRRYPPIYVLVATIAVSSGVTIASAAPPTKKRPESISSTTNLKEFDESLNKLPTAFTGTSIHALLARYRIIPKGEFESSEQFAARRPHFRRTVYALLIPKSSTQAEYDADSEVLSLKIKDESIPIGYTDTSHGVTFDRKLLSSRSYVGRNAFNAKVNVTETIWSNYSLVFDEECPSPSVAIPRANARKYKDRVRALLIVALNDSSIIPPLEVTGSDGSTHVVETGATGFFHADAKIDSPYDVSADEHSLRVDVVAVWMIDPTTGEVLAKATGSSSAASNQEKNPAQAVAGSSPNIDVAQHDPAPLLVGGDVTAPVLISRVDPIYPEAAKKARISGIVIVECVIDTQGNVTSVRVLKPLPFGVDEAAIDAVKQWKFKPGTLNGEPVRVVAPMTVNFSLNDH